MRRPALVVCALVVVLLQVTRAQTPAAAPPRTPAPDSLPVRRVILYKNGVGYFEHLGKVRGNQTVNIDFNSSQLNDVLKTLTVLDLGSGRIIGVSYNSEAPLAQRLGGLRLPIGEHATRAQLLDALRGARLEVRAGERLVSGRLLGVESRARTRDGQTTTVDELTLVSDGGEIHSVDITPAVTVKIAERDSTEQVSAYMGLLASTRAKDRRRMAIGTAGTGERDLLVSYVSEVPMWKTSYRIVLPARAGAAVQLQGWAIVDNTIGEDWRNVELSLVAGAPQSFVQQLSQPLYIQRPVIPLSKSVLVTPQTHQATLTTGSGGIRGRVDDADGAVLPGVTVKVIDASGRVVAQRTTDGGGRYELNQLPPGRYAVVFELAGFRSGRKDDVRVEAGMMTDVNDALRVGALLETVTVTGGSRAPRLALGGAGVAAPPPLPSAPLLPRAELAEKAAQLEPAAQGDDLGDLFEYKVREPISIARNQSALVPIVRADVSADRVSLWNERAGARPLRSLWLTNSSGLTLDSGSFTVLDAGAFAGEGLVDPLKPGEKRLLSYAVDLGVQVEPRNGDERRTVTRVTIARGVLVQHIERVSRRVYTIRNSDTTDRRVVVEHPIRPGWKLASGVNAAETSANGYRFIVAVPASKTETLTVTEQQPVDSTYRIADVSDEQLDVFLRESGNSQALRAALAPVVAAKAALAAINADVNNWSAEMTRIGDDQERVRENLKALKGSAEERDLVRRYTIQLTQQEDRIDALRKESAALERRRLDAQTALARQIEALSATIEVGSGG